MNFDDNYVQKIFLEIREEFRMKIPGMFGKIFQLARQINEKRILNDDVRELYRLSHNLEGSARTFGIDEVAINAKALSMRVNTLINNNEIMFEEINDINYFVGELESSVFNLESINSNSDEVKACG